MNNIDDFIKDIEKEVVRQAENKGGDEDLPNIWFEAGDAFKICSQLKYLYEITVSLFFRCKALTSDYTCNICKYHEMCFTERAKREGGK